MGPLRIKFVARIFRVFFFQITATMITLTARGHVCERNLDFEFQKNLQKFPQLPYKSLQTENQHKQ